MLGGLVQDEDREVGEQGPGQRQPLTLAAGQPGAVFTDRGCRTVGQRVHPVQRAGPAPAPRSSSSGRRPVRASRRFSRTELSNRCASWAQRPTSRARRRRPASGRVRPPRVVVPCSASRKRSSTCTRVVLPEPGPDHSHPHAGGRVAAPKSCSAARPCPAYRAVRPRTTKGKGVAGAAGHVRLPDRRRGVQHLVDRSAARRALAELHGEPAARRARRRRAGAAPRRPAARRGAGRRTARTPASGGGRHGEAADQRGQPGPQRGGGSGAARCRSAPSRRPAPRRAGGQGARHGQLAGPREQARHPRGQLPRAGARRRSARRARAPLSRTPPTPASSRPTASTTPAAGSSQPVNPARGADPRRRSRPAAAGAGSGPGRVHVGDQPRQQVPAAGLRAARRVPAVPAAGRPRPAARRGSGSRVVGHQPLAVAEGGPADAEGAGRRHGDHQVEHRRLLRGARDQPAGRGHQADGAAEGQAPRSSASAAAAQAAAAAARTRGGAGRGRRQRRRVSGRAAAWGPGAAGRAELGPRRRLAADAERLPARAAAPPRGPRRRAARAGGRRAGPWRPAASAAQRLDDAGLRLAVQAAVGSSSSSTGRSARKARARARRWRCPAESPAPCSPRTVATPSGGAATKSWPPRRAAPSSTAASSASGRARRTFSASVPANRCGRWAPRRRLSASPPGTAPRGPYRTRGSGRLPRAPRSRARAWRSVDLPDAAGPGQGHCLARLDHREAPRGRAPFVRGGARPRRPPRCGPARPAPWPAALRQRGLQDLKTSSAAEALPPPRGTAPRPVAAADRPPGRGPAPSRPVAGRVRRGPGACRCPPRPARPRSSPAVPGRRTRGRRSAASAGGAAVVGGDRPDGFGLRLGPAKTLSVGSPATTSRKCPDSRREQPPLPVHTRLGRPADQHHEHRDQRQGGDDDDRRHQSRSGDTGEHGDRNDHRQHPVAAGSARSTSSSASAPRLASATAGRCAARRARRDRARRRASAGGRAAPTSPGLARWAAAP